MTYHHNMSTEWDYQYILCGFYDPYALFSGPFADNHRRYRQLLIRRVPQRKHPVDV